MHEVDRHEISLEKLRSGDGEEWERAYPVLWQVAWRAVSKVCPHATESEKEEMAAAGLTGEGKVVSQITRPTREAFVKAKTFDDMLNLTASVVRNTTIDTVRKNTIRSEEQNQERVEALFGGGGESDPANETAKAERSREIALAVASLEDKYREVIEDFYFRELKTEEIARIRGRPKGTICVELKRARARLGEILRE